MNEAIFEKFSGNHWIVIHHNDLEERILGSYSHNITWKDAFTDQKAEKEWWNAHLFELIISPQLNGYHIIEGKPLVYEKMTDQLLANLSQYAKVYWFRIDLWQPMYQIKVFDQKQCIREYEYYYDNKDNKMVEISKGDTLEIEGMVIPFLTEEEYQEFWTPLAIMEAMGIGQQMLQDALTEPCRVMIIPDASKKMIEQVNSTLNF